MNATERTDFCKTIAALAATMRHEATEALYEGYWLGLGDLPLKVIQQAVGTAIRQCRFMPAPAELRELAGELAPADRAIRAWQAVMRAVRTDGYYHSVNFDDPVINATIRNFGGWERFNERLEEDPEKWLRKDFETVYASFARSGISAEAAAPLGGFFERDNLAHGYHDAIGSPTLIECGLPPHRPGVVPAIQSERQRCITDQTRECVDAIGRMPE